MPLTHPSLLTCRVTLRATGQSLGMAAVKKIQFHPSQLALGMLHPCSRHGSMGHAPVQRVKYRPYCSQGNGETKIPDLLLGDHSCLPSLIPDPWGGHVKSKAPASPCATPTLTVVSGVSSYGAVLQSGKQVLGAMLQAEDRLPPRAAGQQALGPRVDAAVHQDAGERGKEWERPE